MLTRIRKTRFEMNLSNRKYKMIAGELLLILLIVVLSQIIAMFFPIEEPLREFGDSYWLYMLMALIEVILIGAMFFLAGLWYSEWRNDKDVQLVKDLAMADISQEKEKDRPHSF